MTDHTRILIVDDELGEPSAEGRAVDALAAVFRSHQIEVVESRSVGDGLAALAAAPFQAVMVDWRLGDGGDTGAGASAILEAVRASDANVPIFLTADRDEASALPLAVLQMADEFVWTLEDTAPFVAGRVLAAVKRFAPRLPPPLSPIAILIADVILAEPRTERGVWLRSVAGTLRDRGAAVTESLSYDDARGNIVASAGWHLILVAARLADTGDASESATLTLLREIRERNLHVPVFLIADQAIVGEVGDEMAALTNGRVRLSEPAALVGDRLLASAEQYREALLPPFARALLSYDHECEYSWAAPGHQGGVAFTKSPVGRLFFDFYGERLFRTDLGIERTTLGSLLAHSGAIGESERYAARVFGAHRTYAAQNGSSGANRTILSACVGEGEIALVDRNCHKSIEQGLAITGATPVYLRPTRNRFGIIGPIDPASLEPAAIDAAIRATPIVPDGARPTYAVVTNCTYDGICYDAAEIETRLGQRVDRIHFDEAWYAYARFHPLYDRRHAMRGDPATHSPTAPTVFANQSTHKLLAALSQSAFIHIRDGRRPIEHGRFNEAYCLQASTSPLYPLLAGNDVAASMMDGAGGYTLTREAIHEAIACRLALARLFQEFADRGEWFFSPWNPDRVIDPGHHRSVPFRDASPEWLASAADAWVLRGGEPWHGFGDLRDGWCMLDPTKLGIVCPGMTDDGVLSADGVPADLLTAYLSERGIVPSRTTDHMVLFLFTIGVTKGKWGTLVHALLDFKRDFDRNRPLADALPQLAAASPDRYRASGLRDLASEMMSHLHDTRQGYWQARACAELPVPVMTPRRAFQRLMAGEADRLPLSSMAGRVSAVGIIPYPPGIPLVMPGECVGPGDGPWLSYLRALQSWGTRFPGFGKEVEGTELDKGEYHAYCVRE